MNSTGPMRGRFHSRRSAAPRGRGTRGQGDKGTRGQGDRGSRRVSDSISPPPLVPLSPCLLVAPSPCLPVSPSLCGPSVTRVVIHPAVARLLRKREEGERVAERHVVRVDVVAQWVLIGHEEEDSVDRIVTQAASVRETGASIGTAAGADVGLFQVKAQEIAA